MTAEHDDLRWCWTEPHSRQARSSVDATAGFRACPQQGTDFAPATSRAAQRGVDSLQPAPHLRSQFLIEPPMDGRVSYFCRTRNSGSSKEGTMLPRTIFTLVVLFLSGGISAAPPAIPAESGDGGASVDSTVSERFPDLSLPAPGVLSFVPPIKPEVWNDAERTVIKECASGASDEDVALWRLPRDGWVVVATADERLCVCAPHDGKPVLVAMHRIDFGGGSLRGVAGPGIDVGDLDGNGTLDMIFIGDQADVVSPRTSATTRWCCSSPPLPAPPHWYGFCRWEPTTGCGHSTSTATGASSSS